MIQKSLNFIQKDTVVLGPLFLLSTLAISAQAPLDLVLLALFGFYLSARHQVRGCLYAFILLSVVSAVKHIFWTTDHLWQLGIESSLGCTFFITALAFEQGEAFLESLRSQVEIRNAALENIEEELSKVQESTQEQTITFQEKTALLQKELEELQGDHSSILILNEVLRKTTARANQEKEFALAELNEVRRERAILKTECTQVEQELVRLKQTDSVVQQNMQLMKELNGARYEKEQTHLINETLARLCMKETLKAKEADEQVASLLAQLQDAREEVGRTSLPLKEELAAARQEVSALTFQFEKASQEANQGRSALLRLQEIQMERNFLKERLQSALDEISLLQKEPLKEDPHLLERLKFAEEKMGQLSQIEPLFKQLKNQFEEKNQTLHQVRSELFKADTELQKLKIEKAAEELLPLPKEIGEELERMGAQIELLEEENEELQLLISALSETNPDPLKRKKKLKIQTPPEQEFLF